MFAAILDDLRKRFGEKILLTPEDLEKVLGIGRGQQANLRSQNRFPIPTRKVGGKVTVTIYDLAQHLAGDGKAEVKAQMAAEAPNRKERVARKDKKAKRGLLEKGWWQLRADQVIAILENRSLLDELGTGNTLPPNSSDKTL